MIDGRSLSSRRAWIEIICLFLMFLCLFVALLTESVDWNCLPKDVYNMITGRSPHGERGLKSNQLNISLKTSMSLSSRRAWIEIATVIDTCRRNCVALLTESVDWNFIVADVLDKIPASLSSRRAWIEIAHEAEAGKQSSRRSPHGERGLKLLVPALVLPPPMVALLTESVDWNEILDLPTSILVPLSLSSRRAWIEIRWSPWVPLYALVALLTESVDWNCRHDIS